MEILPYELIFVILFFIQTKIIQLLLFLFITNLLLLGFEIYPKDKV